MDWGRLHEWALEDAENQGCTCDEEPEVTLEFCEQHGVHAVHIHEENCNILLSQNAKWN